MRNQTLLLLAILSAAIACTTARSLPHQHGCLLSSEPTNITECHLFSCMENVTECGNSGFLMGFGYRFCTRFSKFKELFSKEGKEWSEAVQVCTLKDTQVMLSNRSATCRSLMEDGLYRIGQCYQTVEPDICGVLQHHQNHKALARVLDVSRLPGQDSQYIINQISDIARSCLYFKYNKRHGSVDDMRRNIRGFLATMLTILPKEPINAQPADFSTSNLDRTPANETDCIRYAKDGDCRFFRCFQKKFPCGLFVSPSHMMHFEFLFCKELLCNISLSPSQEARIWAVEYHKCMFSELLPLYQKDSVSCGHLYGLFSDKRPVCMISTGMCLIKPQYFSMIFYQAIDFDPYPSSKQYRELFRTLTRRGILYPEYYYRHLILFRAQLVGTLCQCWTKKSWICPSLYKEYTRTNETYPSVTERNYGSEMNESRETGTCLKPLIELWTVESTAKSEQDKDYVKKQGHPHNPIDPFIRMLVSRRGNFGVPCVRDHNVGTEAQLPYLENGCTGNDNELVNVMNNARFLEEFLDTSARGHTVLKAAIMCKTQNDWKQIAGFACRECVIRPLQGKPRTRHAEENLKLHVMHRLDTAMIKKKIGESKSRCEFWIVISNQPCDQCSGVKGTYDHMPQLKTYVENKYTGHNSFRLAWSNFYPRLKLKFPECSYVPGSDTDDNRVNKAIDSYKALVNKGFKIYVCNWQDWFNCRLREQIGDAICMYRKNRERQTECEVKVVMKPRETNYQFLYKHDCLYKTDAELTPDGKIDRLVIGKLWPDPPT